MAGNPDSRTWAAPPQGLFVFHQIKSISQVQFAGFLAPWLQTMTDGCAPRKPQKNMFSSYQADAFFPTA
jgi:hypothetical protein